MNRELIKTSKFMSLVLRHDPGSIGLSLDAQGWADVDELVARARSHGVNLDRATLQQIVATSDKQRFALSPDGRRVRANQGHSVGICLGLVPLEPPPNLFHGTATRNLESIRANGLHAAARQHVHLSSDAETARKVGSRHGKPVVLTVDSGAMHRGGHTFHRSENGVWLTEQVPPGFIIFPMPHS